MSILGGILGFLTSIVLYVLTAVFLGLAVLFFGFIVPILSPILIGPLLALLTPASWIVVVVFTTVILYLFAYIIGTISLLPLIAAVPLPPPAAPPLPPVPLPASPLELLMRGFMIGLTAGLNIGMWALLFPPAAIIGLLLGIICFLAVFRPIATSLLYQRILGWSSWLMPMSWIATSVGLLLFLLNLPFAISAFGPAAVQLDGLTGTIETTGGALIGITGFTGGFNLGNFSFITPGPPVVPSPFGVPSLSAHETGHTLNVAALGGVFQWINAFDENPPMARRSLAYGELAAESHFPRGATGLGLGTPPILVRRMHILLWS